GKIRGYYSDLELDPTAMPSSSLYPSAEHTTYPKKDSQMVVEARIINDMKSHLSEEEFWYAVEHLYAVGREKGKIKEETGAVEVGNIFPLGTWYAERMRVYYTDEKGLKKPVWFASYGIGPTRVMGTLVEISHDDRGIIWSPQVSPFDVHLIELPGGKGREIHDRLKKEEVDVLWDERNIQAGVKFGDADLIGISIRLITSEKTGDKIEWKERKSDKTELLTFEEVVNKLRK
ncbi:MAG: Proline-tRNA ligase, partial [Candidatus Woesebacteria bacterium GW2011_GWA2_40_7b]